MRRVETIWKSIEMAPASVCAWSSGRSIRGQPAAVVGYNVQDEDEMRKNASNRWTIDYNHFERLLLNNTAHCWVTVKSELEFQ